MSDDESKWSRDRLLEEVRHASELLNIASQILLAYLTIAITALIAYYALPDTVPFFARITTLLFGIGIIALCVYLVLRILPQTRRRYDRLKAKL